MLQLLKLLLSKKGFKCRIIPPGSVFATKCPNRQLVIVIDLDDLDVG